MSSAVWNGRPPRRSDETLTFWILATLVALVVDGLLTAIMYGLPFPIYMIVAGVTNVVLLTIFRASRSS